MTASASILNANNTDDTEVKDNDNDLVSGDHIPTFHCFHSTDLRKSVSLLTESYISLWIVSDPWSLGISFSDIKSEMKKDYVVACSC